MIIVLFVSGCTMPWVQPKQTITGTVATGVVKTSTVTTQTTENTKKKQPVAGNKSPNAISIESASVEERQAYFDQLPNNPRVTNIFKEKIFNEKLYTWWITTHDYIELGIKIYTNEDMLVKSKAPFIIKTKSMLEDPFNTSYFIEVHAKNPKQSIQEIFNAVYRPQILKDCNIEKIDGSSFFTWNNKFLEAYHVENMSSTCSLKKPGLSKIENVGLFSILYNKKRPDRYYLYNGTVYQWCVGGCSNIFNEIELY